MTFHWDFHHPNWRTHSIIFQRARAQNHQPDSPSKIFPQSFLADQLLACIQQFPSSRFQPIKSNKWDHPNQPIPRKCPILKPNPQIGSPHFFFPSIPYPKIPQSNSLSKIPDIHSQYKWYISSHDMNIPKKPILNRCHCQPQAPWMKPLPSWRPRTTRPAASVRRSAASAARIVSEAALAVKDMGEKGGNRWKHMETYGKNGDFMGLNMIKHD